MPHVPNTPRTCPDTSRVRLGGVGRSTSTRTTIMSSEAVRLARILRNNAPWGPFWDSEALTEKCKSTPARRLELENVFFAVRTNTGKYDCVGACSRLRPLSVRSYPRLSGGEAGRVYFRGDFTVVREDQLTPECLDYIVDKLCELMKRERSAILNFLFPKPPLADRERFPLVIRIQGWKKLPLVAQSQPRAVFTLDLPSVDKERHYSVLSLEAHTYELSRVYLARHHFRLTMQSIIDLHPDPVWLRTPKWFAARYLDLYRQCKGSRWGRILGIPDRGQRHPDAPEPGEFVIGTPTNRPRHLRIIPLLSQAPDRHPELARLCGEHVPCTARRPISGPPR
ncbi:hypothetical protein PENSPDRAFT_412059 [Peniophora sp. CONT]|nr:hypothetical protein PENSPDRAFT_412059 [Peniophora sp. CONT]